MFGGFGPSKVHRLEEAEGKEDKGSEGDDDVQRKERITGAVLCHPYSTQLSLRVPSYL